MDSTHKDKDKDKDKGKDKEIVDQLQNLSEDYHNDDSHNDSHNDSHDNPYDDPMIHDKVDNMLINRISGLMKCVPTSIYIGGIAIMIPVISYWQSNSLLRMLGSLKNVSSKTYAYGTGTALIGTFLWEHIGRQRNWNLRPSIGLNIISTQSQSRCKQFGKLIAQSSLFLTKSSWIFQFRIFRIFKEFFITLEALITPILNLCNSPYYALNEYMHTVYMNQYRNNQSNWLAYIGSGILALTIIGGPYMIWSKCRNINLNHFCQELGIQFLNLKL